MSPCILRVILALGFTTSLVGSLNLEETVVHNQDDWLATSLVTKPLEFFGPGTKDKDPYEKMDGVWSLTNSDGNSTIAPFGFTNIPYSIPMMGDSHFPIASNSKLYTTVAIYQLYEQGKLDVAADITTMLDAEDFEAFGLHRYMARTYCPHLGHGIRRRKCQKLTLQHLLSMSSGIYPPLNCDADPTSRTSCNPDPYFINRGSIGKTIGTFLTQPLMFPPGTQYHYSNPNFILAAYFVEKYSGMTFRDYLETHIFSRMGLNDTYYDYFNQALVMDSKRVGQYVRYYNNCTNELMAVGADVLQLDLGIASGTGGVISTVADHATFWHTLFNKTMQGFPLLSSPSSQTAILTPFTLMGTGVIGLPNGTKLDIWSYYTQGTTMICLADSCPNGPKWILYTGGTVTVHTANLLDYDTFQMAQVWTSTLVAMTDHDTYQAAFDRQIGFPMAVIGPWVENSSPYNNPMLLAFLKLFENYNTKDLASSG